MELIIFEEALRRTLKALIILLLIVLIVIPILCILLTSIFPNGKLDIYTRNAIPMVK